MLRMEPYSVQIHNKLQDSLDRSQDANLKPIILYPNAYIDEEILHLITIFGAPHQKFKSLEGLNFDSTIQ